MIAIRELNKPNAKAVAELHAAAINKGFLAKLGIRFLRQLYLGIADDPESKVWIAVKDEKVLGFCAYSRNVTGMYSRVLRSRFFHLCLASFPAVFNPMIIKEVLDTLRYPTKQNTKTLPKTEILSIAVNGNTRGEGLGKKLLDKAIEQATKDGETTIKVLAGAKLDGANRFYTSYGFQKLTEIIQHGEPLNVYVKDVSA